MVRGSALELKDQQAADQCNAQTLVNEAQPEPLYKQSHQLRRSGQPPIQRLKEAIMGLGCKPKAFRPRRIAENAIENQSQACRVPNGKVFGSPSPPHRLR